MIQSSISKSIWNNRYRYEKETEEDTYKRISHIFDTDDKRQALYDAVKNHKLLPAGRIIHNINTKRTNNTMSNCYVLPIKQDTFDAVLSTIDESIKTWSAGGGVGINFSIMRPTGTTIRSKGETVKLGVIGILNMFNATCINIKGSGDREGALMSVLDIWHPDIMEFMTIKRNLSSLNSMNLSIAISDKFMNAVKEDKQWDLVFPNVMSPHYNDEWDGNLDKWLEKGYDVVVYDTIPATKLYDDIVECGWSFGEPGILFTDTYNKQNTVNYCETISACNPCGEQGLPPYGSCNLASLNLTKFVDNPFTENASFNHDEFSEVTKIAVDMLDTILDVNNYPVKGQLQEVLNKRPIGVGITGLGSALAMLGVVYGSDRSYNIVKYIMKTMSNAAYDMSATLAETKGAFPFYNKDEYKIPSFLNSEVKRKIKKNGVRNSRVISIAPTGTISLFMNNVSSGVEPIYDVEYTRRVRMDNDVKVISCVDYAYDMFVKMGRPKAYEHIFVTALNIPLKQHIDMQITLQQYVDSSISKTLNAPSDCSMDDMRELYTYAWDKGLKGFTVYRDGSRENVISTNSDENKETVDNSIVTKNRIPINDQQVSIRHRVGYKNKSNLLITVGILDDGSPIELVAKVAKPAAIDKNGDFSHQVFVNETALWEAICRLASMALQYGCPVDKVIEQLQDSSLDMMDLPAILARVLSKYPIGDVYIKKHQILHLCPKCNEKQLKRDGGCVECLNCDYTKCS